MNRQLIIVLLLFCIGLLVIQGCASQPVMLDSREITEYKGIPLTPAAELRENSVKGIQAVDLENYSLKIWGEVNKPLLLSYKGVLSRKVHKKIVTLYCVEGWDATILWEGVLIKDLLKEAQVQEAGTTVIFHAYDGYTTSLPLATIIDRDIILAFKANGEVLPDSLGFPFIVVAEDKLGYKWARWVTEIELSGDDEYLGYWEQRGYSNRAELGDGSAWYY